MVKLLFKNYAFFCNAVVFGREKLHALKYLSRAKTSTLNYAQDIQPRRLTHRTSTNVPQKSSTDCTPSPSSIAARFSLRPANKQLYKRTSSFTQLTAEKIETKFAAPANLFQLHVDFSVSWLSRAIQTLTNLIGRLLLTHQSCRICCKFTVI